MGAEGLGEEETWGEDSTRGRLWEWEWEWEWAAGEWEWEWEWPRGDLDADKADP